MQDSVTNGSCISKVQKSPSKTQWLNRWRKSMQANLKNDTTGCVAQLIQNASRHINDLENVTQMREKTLSETENAICKFITSVVESCMKVFQKCYAQQQKEEGIYENFLSIANYFSKHNPNNYGLSKCPVASQLTSKALQKSVNDGKVSSYLYIFSKHRKSN